ncbi:T9SS type A sorting domain-containing protein [Candidatus Latescibacterota bacterium]
MLWRTWRVDMRESGREVTVGAWYLDVSADGSRIALSGGVTLEVLDADLRPIATAPSQGGQVRMAPGGDELVLWSDSAMVRLAVPSLATVEQHPRGVSAAYSKDGSLFAWLDRDGIVRVHDRGITGPVAYRQMSRPQRAIWEWGAPGGTDPATVELALRFSGGGALLAVAVGPVVHLLDAEHGTVRVSLENEWGAGVVDVAFSPDARYMLTLHGSIASRGLFNSRGLTHVLWDLSLGTVLEHWEGKLYANASMPGGFAPFGTTYLAVARGFTAQDDDLVLLWDLASQQHSWVWFSGATALAGVVVDPEGRRLAVGGYDGVVYVWDASRRRLLHRLTGPKHRAKPVAFSADGARLLAIWYDTLWHVGELRQWDVDSGSLLARKAYRNVGAFALSGDGRTLAACSGTDSVELWDLEIGRSTLSIPGRPPLAFVLQDQGLLVGGGKALWDPRTGEMLGESLFERATASVLYSGPGNLIGGLTDISFVVGNVETMEQVSEIHFSGECSMTMPRLDDGSPGCRECPGTCLGPMGGAVVSVSPDFGWLSTGRYYASYSDVILWDLATGQSVTRQLRGLSTKAEFSQDSRWCARYSLAPRSQLAISQARNSGTMGSFHVDGHPVEWFFLPGDEGLVLIEADTLRVLSVPRAEELRRVEATSSGGALSPDGQWLVTWEGSLLKVWEMPSLTFAGSLEGHTKPILEAAFTADNNYLVSRAEDKTVVVWEREGVTAVAETGTGAAASPEKLRLLPAYPNPSNPGFYIPYELAAGGDVTIAVYSVTGQLVKTVLRSRQEPGRYAAPGRAAYWDGRDESGRAVASGVYVCRLEAGGLAKARRLVVLR